MKQGGTMRELWLFIKYIPAFYRLWKEWGMYPGYVDFALHQYIEVINVLTCGKLSKPCYGAAYIIEEIKEHFCDDCDLKNNT